MSTYNMCEACGSQTMDGQCTNCYWRALDEIIDLTNGPIRGAMDNIRLIATEARDYGCLEIASSSDTIGVRLRRSR